MKRLNIIYSAVVMLFILASCSNDEQITKNAGSDNQDKLSSGMVHFTLPAFASDSSDVDGETTKTVYSEAKGKLVWSDKDTIGVFPQQGSPIYYSMADGAGDDVAEFDGGGWQLKPGTTYYSYAPFYPSVYLKSEAIPYTTIGQVQQSNGVRNHDGFDCLWARECTAGNSSVNFIFTRLCCFLKFTLAPGKGTFTEFNLSSDDAIIPVRGTFDIKEETPVLRVSAEGYATSLSLGLNNITISSDDENMVLYMAFIPCDISGKKMTISVKDIDGKIQVFEKTFSKAFVAGTLYNVRLERNYLLSQTDFGMYDLAENKSICTYVSGKDSYSYVKTETVSKFRIMNPSVDDKDYKFIEMTLVGIDVPSSIPTVEIYAPSFVDYDNRSYGVSILKRDNENRIWLISSDQQLGFIVKQE